MTRSEQRFTRWAAVPVTAFVVFLAAVILGVG